jgi:predicted DNA-binding protein (MmcQ/YjbR family)
MALTAAALSKLALSLPGARESSHMGHPDFRVAKKIFATLDEARTRSALKLTPEQQEMLCSAEPSMFQAVNGGWGAKGWTHLLLKGADQKTALSALRVSYGNVVPKAKPARNQTGKAHGV